MPIGVILPGDLAGSLLPVLAVTLAVSLLVEETFGWSTRRAIVPGFLAGIATASLASAFIFVAEGASTCLLARAVGRGIRGSRAYAVLFDRQRLLIFLVLGLACRGAIEGLLLPATGFLDRNLFGALGIVLVPLVAEHFWDDGLGLALIPLGVPAIGGVFLTRLLLAPLGYDPARFAVEYGYGLELPVGPVGTYIFVMAAAFVIAGTNDRRGYSTNGIVFPVLFALAWLEPGKLLYTLVLAAAIAASLRALAVRPLLQFTSLGGSRGGLLVVTGFLVIEAAASLALGRSPGFQAGDLLGFGHILGPVLAWKMREEGVAAAFRPIALTSLQGLAAGALLLGAVALVAPGSGEYVASASPTYAEDEGDLYIRIALEQWKVEFGGPEELFRSDTRRVEEAVRKIEQALAAGDPAAPGLIEHAARLLDPLGLQAVRYLDRPTGRSVVIVRESAEDERAIQGRGLVAIGGNPAADVVLIVPPDAGLPAVGVAAALFRQVGMRALIVEPAWRSRSNVPFSTVDAVRAALPGALPVRCRISSEDPPRWVGPPPPASLVLFLERWGDDVAVVPSDGPAELLLGNATAERIVAAALGAVAPPVRDIDVPMGASLLGRGGGRSSRPVGAEPQRGAGVRGMLLGRGASEMRTPPSRGAARFLRQAVLDPLFDFQNAAARGTADPLALTPVAGAALSQALGCELERYRYARTGDEYLLLRTQASSPFRGIVLLSLAPARNLVLGAPYPAAERYTFEAAVRLFEHLDARAVVIAAGSEEDPSQSLYGVAMGAFLDHPPPERPFVLEVRGFAAPGGASEVDMVISTGRERRRRSEVSAEALSLLESLRGMGTVRFFDGGPETAFLEAPPSPTGGAAANAGASASYGIAWLSRRFREGFRVQPEGSADRLAAEALGIDAVSGNLVSFAALALEARERTEAVADPATRAEVAAIEAEMKAYIERRHVARLARAVERSRAISAEITLFYDEGQNQEYLILVPPPRASQILFVGSLAAHATDDRVIYPEAGDPIAALEAFRRQNGRSIGIEVHP